MCMKGETSLLLALCLLYSTHSNADISRYEAGLRVNLLLGNGRQTNDMIGYGIAGRYYLTDGWFIGAALENYDFDFERPFEVVDLEQDRNVDIIDVLVSTTVVGAALGKQYGAENAGFDWFWSIGIGAGFPEVDSSLVITGRKKDLIIINGRNIWPQDLEYLAEQQPEIRIGDALAFSVPNPYCGESCALVAQGREYDPQKRADLADRLVGTVRIELGIDCYVEMVPLHTLPRGSSGKLSRSRARQTL